MGLFGAAKADPKKQVNEMSQLLRPVVDRHDDYPDGILSCTSLDRTEISTNPAAMHTYFNH